MKRLYVAPQFDKPDAADGGIRRVVEAQARYLPDHGWVIIQDPYSADLVACHAGTYCDRNIDAAWVAHCHGLYWGAEMEFGQWATEANAHVIINLKRADAITAPSEWVAQSIRRGLCTGVDVIGHGIEPDEWDLGQSQGYVLWNKARQDVVCDPAEMNKLAAMCPDVKFLSTFGQERTNVSIMGKVPYDSMRETVRNAGVYLCTARETFGIGTLEAMAAGVPVLAWRHGGQVDIIQHQEHGWLSTPGDYDDLARGLRYCLANRARLGAAARDHVLTRYLWRDVIARYAQLYDRVLARGQQDHSGPKVSVVVTCYNLAQFLGECLESIRKQTMFDWECIIVDDCSPDNTPEVAADWTAKDPRIKYVRNETNQYLAEARNVGIRASHGQYILCLDADDMLEPRALEILSEALDRNHSIDIAYGHMEAFYPERRDGNQRERGDWPTAFRMEQQMAGRNQLPYASMYRRRAWERVGGYRQHIRTAEDADFWCRVTGYGFKPAKVTEAVFLVKRELTRSMSRVEPVSRDWRDWAPWARNPRLAPFGAVLSSTQREERHAWPVRSHAKPRFSVVIPVGPGHSKAVIKAIDSVVAQTTPDWEAIIVNDTGGDLSLPGFPFAKVITTSGKAGAGAARNAGAKVALGQFLTFLDADDWLHPEFLRTCSQVWKDPHEYVYTNSMNVRGATIEEFDPGDITSQDHLKESKHPVTTLLPRQAWVDVGGFDEVMLGWEDWDFYIALAVAGYVPVHLPTVLVAYDLYSGERREAAIAAKAKLIPYLHEKWFDYIEGNKEMGCGSCGRRASAPPPVAPVTDNVQSSIPVAGGAVDQMVMIEYADPRQGDHLVFGRATATKYGIRSQGDHFYVDPRDIAIEPARFRVA